MNTFNNLPNKDNLFVTLNTSLTKIMITHAFENNGWNIRRCSLEDYEMRCSWGELIVEGIEPLLLHGGIHNIIDNVDKILEILKSLSIVFSLECYNENDELLYKYDSK